jgi:hypothetical protein
MGGTARLMIEFLLEYSDRSVIGVRFGSREITLPLMVLLTGGPPAGPKKPPLEYSYVDDLVLELRC